MAYPKGKPATPAQLATLQKYRKQAPPFGTIDNPSGRPKGFTPISVYLRRWGMKAGSPEDLLNRPDLSYNEQAAMAWLAQAIAGDMNALREILDRTEGKVPNVNKIEQEVKVTWVQVANALEKGISIRELQAGQEEHNESDNTTT